MSADTDYTVACPMPDCHDLLYLDWSMTYGLSPEDLAESDLPTPAGAHSSNWQVTCTAGHVILLPGDTGCPCIEDQGGANCPHNDLDYDWSEDDRAFREADATRLRVLIEHLNSREPEPTMPG